jgi:hypothetical protein
MKKRDRFVDMFELIASLVFILGGVILIIYIIPSQISGKGEIPDARTLPYAFSILMILLSLGWTMEIFKKGSRQSGKNIIKGTWVGCLLLFLASLQELIGYLPAGCVAIGSVCVMIKWGRWVHVLIFSVCVTVLYYVFFWKALSIEFPRAWLSS